MALRMAVMALPLVPSRAAAVTTDRTWAFGECYRRIVPDGQGQRARALPLVDDGLGAGSNGAVGCRIGRGGRNDGRRRLRLFLFRRLRGRRSLLGGGRIGSRVGRRTFVRVRRRGLGRRRIVNHHRAAFAGGEPNIENRMLDAVQARTVGEHPARENALDLLLLVDFVDLGEGVGLRRIGRRAGIADARRDLQGAELHRLVDRHFERNDAAGDLVEAVEDGDRIADLVGERRVGQR